MSIDIHILGCKFLIPKVLYESLASVRGIAEVPEWVCRRAFPDAFVASRKQSLKAPVHVGDFGVQAQHGDDPTEVQVVPVVLQAEPVAPLDVGHELAPARD